uniref:Uncharacterized protein n=1 Tax=Arundo donax TaxID=35708 RepID=A0A0A8Z4H0_ARUDO
MNRIDNLFFVSLSVLPELDCWP